MKNNNQANNIESVFGRIEGSSPHEAADSKPAVLWITIPYTTPELTLSALCHAGVCTDLDLRVFLVDVQVIPYPCAIDEPPLDRKYSARRLQQILEDSGLQGKSVVLYGRDWLEGFGRALDPGALVIIATKKRYWQTKEKRLAQKLSAAGREVMLVTVGR